MYKWKCDGWIVQKPHLSVHLIKTKDIYGLDYYPFTKNPCKKTVQQWINVTKHSYAKFCKSQCKNDKKKLYTFKGWDDVFEYVKNHEERIAPIAIYKLNNNGPIVIQDGRHRWAAAYMLDIEYIPCCFQPKGEYAPKACKRSVEILSKIKY